MDPVGAIKELLESEPFPRFMGLEVLEVRPGYALVEAPVREEFLNIHKTTHGGVLFSLVDEAFELASNSHGQVAVALNMNITYFRGTSAGDVLRAEAKEVFRSPRTATYHISVTDQGGNLVASCQAVVYRKKELLPNLAFSQRADQ
jgi:acyl-CoA thioesterase